MQNSYQIRGYVQHWASARLIFHKNSTNDMNMPKVLAKKGFQVNGDHLDHNFFEVLVKVGPPFFLDI